MSLRKEGFSPIIKLLPKVVWPRRKIPRRKSKILKILTFSNPFITVRSKNSV